MKKIVVIIIAIVTLLIVLARVVDATAAPKVFVCKYVGTPGVNETLQTGQNPISVSSNAIKDYAGVGSSFNDKQGRSYVVALDTGQDEPNCPVPENEPVDVCSNIEGNQEVVPEGYTEDDRVCTKTETPPIVTPTPKPTPVSLAPVQGK
jgi:hypothetical protein